MSMTIKQKQWQLYFLDCYDSNTLNIDGVWADGSETATNTFQKLFGLKQDGIFGPLTEAKSIEIIKGIQTAAKAYVPGLIVDGLAGWDTVNATKKMQAALGLKADGIAGEITRAKLEGKTTTAPKPTTSTSTGKSFWSEIKYFKREEFMCHCGGKYCNGYPVEPQELLMRTADKIREELGVPMIPSSGVRCSRHNSAVGGVSNSRHLKGKAMDFCAKGKTAAQVLAVVKKYPEIRYAYAIDNTYVHMDIL